MVLRAEALRVRLKRLEEVISHLEELRRTSHEPGAGDFRTSWAIERGLQLGAEILFDLGNHILGAHFGASPDSYGGILQQLATHQVIPQDLATRLGGLGGFRNILVHAYLDIDPVKVEEHLQHAPEDFRACAAAIRGWWEKTGGDGGGKSESARS